MSICVECGEPVPQLVLIEHNSKTVAQCPSCRGPADRYLEYDWFQTFLSLILLHVGAFRHLIFNVKKMSLLLAIIIIISALVESYLTISIRYFKDMALRSHSTHMPSLQITYMLNAYKYSARPLMRFDEFPKIFLYCLFEFFFLGIIMIWGATLFIPKSRPYHSNHIINNEAYSRTFYIFALAKGWSLCACPRLFTLLFLIWRLPVHLIILSELALAGWMLTVLYAIGLSFKHQMFVLILAFFSQILFRVISGWAPVFHAYEALIITSQS